MTTFKVLRDVNPTQFFSDTHTRHQDQSSAFWQSVDRRKWGENEVEERNLFTVEPDVSELFAECKKSKVSTIYMENSSLKLSFSLSRRSLSLGL